MPFAEDTHTREMKLFYCIKNISEPNTHCTFKKIICALALLDVEKKINNFL